MKKVLIPVLLSMLTTPAFAGTWVNLGQVEGTYVDMRANPGRFLVKHSLARTDDCTNSGNVYHLDLGTDDAKLAVAVIQSAEARGKEVRFYYEGCSVAGYPIIKIASTF